MTLKDYKRAQDIQKRITELEGYVDICKNALEESDSVANELCEMTLGEAEGSDMFLLSNAVGTEKLHDMICMVQSSITGEIIQLEAEFDELGGINA